MFRLRCSAQDLAAEAIDTFAGSHPVIGAMWQLAFTSQAQRPALEEMRDSLRLLHALLSESAVNATFHKPHLLSDILRDLSLGKLPNTVPHHLLCDHFAPLLVPCVRELKKNAVLFSCMMPVFQRAWYLCETFSRTAASPSYARLFDDADACDTELVAAQQADPGGKNVQYIALDVTLARVCWESH
jgi:hypothetical protein